MSTDVLIITDSRGDGLDAYLAYYLEGCTNICFESLKGASFKDIRVFLEKNVQDLKFDYAAIIAGICSFTIKKDGRLSYFRSPFVREPLIQGVISEINKIREILSPAKVSIATIPPASIGKHYWTIHDLTLAQLPPGTEDQQCSLVLDIFNTNNEITDNNIAAGIKKILNVADYTFVNSLKRRNFGNREIYKRTTRFSDKGLWDGVDFDETLKHKIFCRIVDLLQEEIDSLKAASAPPTPAVPVLSLKIVVPNCDNPEHTASAELAASRPELIRLLNQSSEGSTNSNGPTREDSPQPSTSGLRLNLKITIDNDQEEE